MRRGWKAFFWPLVCLFQVGLIAGTLLLGSDVAESEKPAAVEAPAEPSPLAAGGRTQFPEPGKLGPTRSELDDVDCLLRAERYELAVVLCRSSSGRAIAELRDAFQYRLGLCLEGLGRWDEALTAYRKLASHAPSIRTAAVASLGEARIWLRMRRPTESKALLCDLLRRSALAGLRGQQFLADASYLLALAAAFELLPNEPPGPFNDSPVYSVTSDWAFDRALDWDRSGRPPEPKPPSDQEIVEVQRGGDGIVRIFVAQMPLTSLLDRLTKQARLSIEWSAVARRQIEERSLIIALEDVSLPDALRLLVEPLGLAWTLESGKLRLASEEETTPGELRSLRLASARRALRDALRTYPRHPLTAAAYLVVGNLETLAGHLDEALTWYGRLTREWPRSPLVVEAQYNLGLIRWRQNDRAAARQAFYRVVDRAPAHELTPLAYWRIGRTYLEEGEAEQALSPLRRAMHNSTGSPAQAAAVLTSAVAHLLIDNPRAADAVLRDNRELLNRSSYRNTAAFLDTLARFRAADRRQRQREASDLLAVLLTVQADPLLGPEGLALMGQAYRELGMHHEMARFYQKALKRLHGPLASKLTLELAEEHWAADRPEAALSLYRTLIAEGSSSEAKCARLRLAQIALVQKKPQDCLKSCRELLQEKTGVDMPAVLRLMAQAYELSGEHAKAIRCLSGQLP